LARGYRDSNGDRDWSGYRGWSLAGWREHLPDVADALTFAAGLGGDTIPAYVAVRKEVIKHEPAFMLAIIPGLVWPQIRVEIEVIAAA